MGKEKKVLKQFPPGISGSRQLCNGGDRIIKRSKRLKSEGHPATLKLGMEKQTKNAENTRNAKTTNKEKHAKKKKEMENDWCYQN